MSLQEIKKIKIGVIVKRESIIQTIQKVAKKV